jgi:hypothetical protein
VLFTTRRRPPTNHIGLKRQQVIWVLGNFFLNVLLFSIQLTHVFLGFIYATRRRQDSTAMPTPPLRLKRRHATTRSGDGMLVQWRRLNDHATCLSLTSNRSWGGSRVGQRQHCGCWNASAGDAKSTAGRTNNRGGRGRHVQDRGLGRRTGD